MSATTIQSTNPSDAAGVPPAPPETHQPAAAGREGQNGELFATATATEAEALDEGDAFFAPVSFDLIDSLLSEFDTHRRSIAAVAEFVSGRMASSVIHYFLEGNRSEDRGRTSLEMSSAQLFDPEGALGALRASYWSKALQLTDVLDLMPQKRRDKWHTQIRHPLGIKGRQWKHSWEAADAVQEWESEPLPEFEEATVRDSLAAMLADRALYFGERVDGIFQGLSGEHVTNAPEAFGKRMIIAHALNEHHYTDHRRTGLINDLRCVIAKFMGRDEPKYQATDGVITRMARARQWGEWVILDGGALRIRIYKVGTAHLEVHPDMAWRLNSVLSSLYPTAIPAQFRQRPKRKAKAVELIKRPLPFAVLAVLDNLRQVKEKVKDAWPERYQDVPNTVGFGYDDMKDKHVAQEVHQVLASLGGTPTQRGQHWVFDYNPCDVIAEVVTSGCVPDQKAHQFYATRERLARLATDAAREGALPDGWWCEPSAGMGGLAEFMPKDRTVCVEVSRLHAKVLEAKGFKVTCADFLSWPRNRATPAASTASS